MVFDQTSLVVKPLQRGKLFLPPELRVLDR
jgi:hypothetical protein